MTKTIGYAAQSATEPLKPIEFERREPDATIVLVGALEPLEPIDHSQVAFHRRSIAGSLIGSVAETQAVLDFCAKHSIVSDVEMISIDRINEAYERMLKGDVKYRFVIDMASLKG
jgi:alcohol dehydrogenase (NADP+)